MTRLSSLAGRLAMAVLVGGTVLLAGCHRGATKEQVAALESKGQFDTVIKAYKGGQFLIDGAVLSALDTGSHFAYLKEVGKLPKTVLLVPSDDYSIRKEHLQYLARMQLDYGFVAYYDKKGTLVQINPEETKTRRLEDYHGPAKMDDQMKGKDAAGSSMEDRSQGY
ncbi:hypothetical protein [Dyella ginsengisoli]|uniref:hypothetical protein n=1 Tax=Dyella ginsengisoli TaxID=363848 RepID=UPI0003823DF6|nr:hypothetical protein [Dyella ginsengisoli]